MEEVAKFNMEATDGGMSICGVEDGTAIGLHEQYSTNTQSNIDNIDVKSLMTLKLLKKSEDGHRY